MDRETTYITYQFGWGENIIEYRKWVKKSTIPGISSGNARETHLGSHFGRDNREGGEREENAIVGELWELKIGSSLVGRGAAVRAYHEEKVAQAAMPLLSSGSQPAAREFSIASSDHKPDALRQRNRQGA